MENVSLMTRRGNKILDISKNVQKGNLKLLKLKTKNIKSVLIPKLNINLLIMIVDHEKNFIFNLNFCILRIKLRII